MSHDRHSPPANTNYDHFRVYLMVFVDSCATAVADVAAACERKRSLMPKISETKC